MHYVTQKHKGLQFDTITARHIGTRIQRSDPTKGFVPRGCRNHTTVQLRDGEYALIHNCLYDRGMLGRIVRLIYRVEQYLTK